MVCASDFIEAMPMGYDTYIEQGGANKIIIAQSLS